MDRTGDETSYWIMPLTGGVIQGIDGPYSRAIADRLGAQWGEEYDPDDDDLFLMRVQVRPSGRHQIEIIHNYLDAHRTDTDVEDAS